MNCCKLRYMKILGGLRAVPEKPNLTNVLTKTPFMTFILQFSLHFDRRGRLLQPLGPGAFPIRLQQGCMKHRMYLPH